jgi:hypothetical protein
LVALLAIHPAVLFFGLVDACCQYLMIALIGTDPLPELTNR